MRVNSPTNIKEKEDINRKVSVTINSGSFSKLNEFLITLIY